MGLCGRGDVAVGTLLFDARIQLADASVVIPLDFLRLPLIAVVGYFAYGETINVWVPVGAAIVFVATWLNLRSAGPGSRHGAGMTLTCRQAARRPTIRTGKGKQADFEACDLPRDTDGLYGVVRCERSDGRALERSEPMRKRLGIESEPDGA